jgi:hypothetical protein
MLFNTLGIPVCFLYLLLLYFFFLLYLRVYYHNFIIILLLFYIFQLENFSHVNPAPTTSGPLSSLSSPLTLSSNNEFCGGVISSFSPNVGFMADQQVW